MGKKENEQVTCDPRCAALTDAPHVTGCLCSKRPTPEQLEAAREALRAERDARDAALEGIRGEIRRLTQERDEARSHLAGVEGLESINEAGYERDIARLAQERDEAMARARFTLSIAAAWREYAAAVHWCMTMLRQTGTVGTQERLDAARSALAALGEEVP